MADAEHKVLYRAIADFSELIREAAAARVALAALNRDAAKLGNLKPVRLFDREDATTAQRTATETGRLTETVTKHGKAVGDTVRQRKAAAAAAKEQADAERSLGAVFSDVARQQAQALSRRQAVERDTNAIFSDANADLEEGQKSLAAVFSDVARAREAATAATQAHTAVLLANTLAANDNENALRPDGGGGGVGAGGVAASALLLGQNQPPPPPPDVSGLERSRQAAREAVAEWEESLQRITGLHHDFEKERLRDWTEALREEAVRERRRTREAEKAAEAEAKAEAAREAKRIQDPEEARAAAEAEQRRRTWWRRQTVERAWESALKMDAEFEKRRQRQLDKLHAEALKMDEQRRREREAILRRSAPDLAREARAGINEATSPRDLQQLLAQFQRMSRELAAAAQREAKEREAAAKRAAAEARAQERLAEQERKAEEKRAAAEARAASAEERRLAREAEAEAKKAARERATEARRIAREAEAEAKKVAREAEAEAKRVAREAEVEARKTAERLQKISRPFGLIDATDIPELKSMGARLAQAAKEGLREQDRVASELNRNRRRAETEAARASERETREEEARAERVRKAWEKAYESRSRFGKLLLRLAYPEGPETAAGGDDGGGGRRRRRRREEDFGGEQSNRGFLGLLRHNLAIQTLIRLLPLIPPLVGAAAASLAAFGTAGVAALSGIVGFAVAAIGHIADLKSAIDDFQATGVLPTGPMGEMVQTVYLLKAAYDDFLKSTQAPVFDVFNKAMAIAVTLLDKFEPLVNAAAGALSNVGDMIAAAIDSPEFARFLEFLQRQAPQAIESFGAALINIAQGVMNLLVAFEPFIESFLTGFERMTQSFKEWADSLRGSEQLAEFFAWAREVGPEIVEMFRSIGAALIQLGIALAPLGGLLITLITAFAKFVDWTLEFLPLAEQLIVVLGLLAIALKLKGLLESVAALRIFVGALRALYTAQGAAAVMGVLTAAITRFGVSARVAAGAATVLTTALRGLLLATGIGALFVAAAALVDAFTGSQNEAADAAAAHKRQLDELTRSIYENNGALTEAQKLRNVQLAQDFGAYEVAKFIGIDEAEMTKAVTGDVDAVQRILTAARAKIEEHLENARQAQARGDDDTAERERNIATALQFRLKVFEDFTGNIAKAQQGADRLKELLDGAGNAALSAAAKQKLFNDTLAAMQSPPTGPLDNAISALESYRDAVSAAAAAELDLQGARASAASNNARAISDVRRAERDVVSAQRDAWSAQRDLTEARREAREKLEDLKNELADLPLREDEAAYAVDRAADDLRKTLANPAASLLDRRQAELELRRSRADLRDERTEAARIRREYRERAAAGIEGSPEVLRAKERIVQATERQREANERLIEAQANVGRVFAEGQRSIQEAETRYKLAKEKVSDLGVALDLAAAASGRTREQVIRDAAIINAAKAEFQVKVNSGQLSDFNARLAETMALFLAFQLMNDPRNANVPFPVLMQQARDQVAGMMASLQPAVTTRSGRGAATRGDRDNYAEGGAVEGPGTSTSDSIPARLSAGEHVWTAAEVIAAGGHAAVRAIRAAAKSGALRSLPALSAAFGPEFVAPGRFDVGSLYRGLNANARSVSFPVARFADGGPVPASSPTVVNNTTRSGMQIGDVIINNPVRERSDRSIRRTVQMLAYLHDR